MAGARPDARENDLGRLRLGFELHPIEPTPDFDAAARIHRRCRRVGVAPGSLIDCLIAAVAWWVRAPLLAQDVDLRRVAEIVGIEIVDGA